MDTRLNVMQSYSDDQLLAIVQKPIEKGTDKRLWQLIEALEFRQLTEDEDAELKRLRAEADDEVLLRSAAFAHLHERGYDVRQYFLGSD